MATNHEWCKDFQNVLKLAHWLVDNGHLWHPAPLLDYFAAPWKWSDEWVEMLAETETATV